MTHTHSWRTIDGQTYTLNHRGLFMDDQPVDMSEAYAVAETTAPFEWSTEFRTKLVDLLRLHRAKANDYTAGSVDPLFNYRMAALVAGVNAPAIMLARIQEKVTRLSSLSRVDQQVMDESRRDTLMDIANIALLIANELDRRAWHEENGTDAWADFRQALNERDRG